MLLLQLLLNLIAVFVRRSVIVSKIREIIVSVIAVAISTTAAVVLTAAVAAVTVASLLLHALSPLLLCYRFASAMASAIVAAAPPEQPVIKLLHGRLLLLRQQ